MSETEPDGGDVELEVSTTKALSIAPAPSGGRGARLWWAFAIALVVGVIVAALRVGQTSAPSSSTDAPSTTAATIGAVTTAGPAPTDGPAATLGPDLVAGAVVKTDVMLPVLPYDVAVLDDAHRLWVLHPADGTATYQGQVELDQISMVGAAAPPHRPSLNVSDSGWLLVGGTFGTVSVNPDGQHILTVHAGAQPVSWDGNDSRTYTWSPDMGTVHVVFDGGAGWLPEPIRLGPMDRRIIVDAQEGSFLIQGDDVTVLTTGQILDANQRFFAERTSGGALVIAELGSNATVGVVSPSFLVEPDATDLTADPELQVSLAPDGRTVALLDPFRMYIVDVASGAGGQVSLTRGLDPLGNTRAAWDPAGQVVTWVVDGEIRVLDLDGRSASIGPTIGNDGPISVGVPVAAVAFPSDPATRP